MKPRAFLAGLEMHGVKLGLDNITHLLGAAGNPHNGFPAIHVAGTNGKGSVLAFLDAMLTAAGYSTGRFTSPHLVELSERFMFGGRPIGERELDEHIAYFQHIAEAMTPPPTYFELVTAVAFRALQARGVDAGLVEVGMGGRFDSTNVLRPIVTAVTNIDLEHTKYLGDTLAKIAFEKAGILKPGIPAVVSEEKPEAQQVILERAAQVGAPARLINRDFRYWMDEAAAGQLSLLSKEEPGERHAAQQGLPLQGTSGGCHATQQGPPLKGDSGGCSFLDTDPHRLFSCEAGAWRIGPVRLGLAGGYQAENAATAVALAELLHRQFPRLTPESAAQGLQNARWPCRLERVLAEPPVYIDVAHNAAGAARLSKELPPCIVVLAVSSDKNAAAMIDALSPITRELILTEFTGSRALPLDRLREAAGRRAYRWEPSLPHALTAGMKLASPDCPLLVTGSIFCAGEARQLLVQSHHAAPLAFV